ncbi:hypothetical protein DFH28DRAFT_290400 [Melampsora americana]|nr:hypothetical protein DFH28DRAFT_290400 [Melampsora americana]
MSSDWPFLHLNVLSPNPSSREIDLNHQNNLQDLSLPSIELDRQLEAWTNIDFNFDLDPISPHSNLSSNNNNNNNNNHHLLHSLNHSSCDLSDSVNENSGSFDDLFNFPTTHLFQPNNSISHDHNPSSYLIPGISSTTLNESIPTPSLPIQDQLVDSSIQFSPKSVLIPSTLSVSQTSEIQTDQNKNEEHLSIEKAELDDDEANKVAIEDDKRRRNTLASARFRMKKKLKEQEIERSAKEMKDKVNELEKEVESLKQENKWLRGLIVEQATNKSIPVQLISKDLEPISHQSELDPEPEPLTSNLTVKSKSKKSTSTSKRIKLSK